MAQKTDPWSKSLRAVSRRNAGRRVLGWEELDVQKLAKEMEISPVVIIKLLTGKSVVGAAGMIKALAWNLGLGIEAVVERIELARKLREARDRSEWELRRDTTI